MAKNDCHNAPFFRIETTSVRFYPTSLSLSEFVIKSILPFDPIKLHLFNKTQGYAHIFFRFSSNLLNEHR